MIYKQDMNFKIFFIVDAHSLPASHFCSMVKIRHNTNQKWTFINIFINSIWFSIKWGNLWVFQGKKRCVLYSFKQILVLITNL